ncbi:MAG: hypothetical protein MPL62_08380 [Alphaproteobacteria bacterium]|nr:hypothetical protein [Alphaproteobacteria bacterium]
MQGENGHPTLDADLEKMIKRAEKLAEKASKKYQEKAFEIVLNTMCHQIHANQHTNNKDHQDSEDDDKFQNEVEVFMKKYDIKREQINRCFLISQTGDIDEIYRSKEESATEFQIQIACMKALKHALQDGSFQFSAKEVRDACKHKKSYKHGNFFNIFERRENLFQSMKNHNHIVLSGEGLEKLMSVINELAPRNEA